MDPIEHRFPVGRYVEVLLRYDGRVLEYFNFYDGSGRRMLVPETRLERSGPDRKGNVTYKLVLPSDTTVLELEAEADVAVGLDAFFAAVGAPR